MKLRIPGRHSVGSGCPFAFLWEEKEDRRGRPPLRRREPIERPPGPRGWPIVGNYFSFRRDPVRFFVRLARRYGDVSYFRFGGEEHYFLNNPDDIRDFLVRDAATFEKAGLLVQAKKIFGDGLLTSEGGEHRRQRRVLQPAFTASALRRYGERMPAAIEAATAGWKSGEVRDITAEMGRLALGIVIQAIFDDRTLERGDDLSEAAEDVLAYFDPARAPVAPLWREYLPRARRFRAARERFEHLASRLARDASAATPSNSIVSQIVSAMNETGVPETKRPGFLKDQIITLLLAGHETVATALNWTLYLLARHPESALRAQNEIDDVCAGAPPTAEAVEHMPYVERVFKESMRLFPPGWVMKRRARVDYQVGRYVIPAGSMIGVSPYVTQRDPRYWESPDRFDPDRWSESRSIGRPAYSYFPFSGGPRGCIGAGFAMLEGKLVLATLLQRWHFDWVGGQRIRLKPLITLRPADGIRLRLRRRAVRLGKRDLSPPAPRRDQPAREATRQ